MQNKAGGTARKPSRPFCCVRLATTTAAVAAAIVAATAVAVEVTTAAAAQEEQDDDDDPGAPAKTVVAHIRLPPFVYTTVYDFGEKVLQIQKN